MRQAALTVELQHKPTAKDRNTFGNNLYPEKIDAMTAIRDSVISRVRIAQSVQKEQYDRKHDQQQFSIRNKVLLKNLIRGDKKGEHFTEHHTGPYTVAEISLQS
ncbi:Hypothetical predicted protein [Octopus vulgaris]|uniref:Uncharacterized protein n=1 Tax=Octopus vulgaris TaxID=6645 RepID=A0AA36BRV8_OCTVU|nr:Hypothetical predicted protein [Octopus vulgaris]